MHRLVWPSTVDSVGFHHFIFPRFLPGVHVGRNSDQPGGDQAKSQSLSGEREPAVCVSHIFGFTNPHPIDPSPPFSSPGLHPARALQGCRTTAEAPIGAEGKRAPLLHTLLPCLGSFQNSPLINTLICTHAEKCSHLHTH